MSALTMLHPRRSPLLRDRATEAAARGSWPLVMTLAALIAAAAALLTPITSSPQWLIPAVLGSAAVLLVAQLVRQLTASVGWSALAAYATVLITLVIAAQPTSPLGVFTAVGERVGEFVQQLASDLPPLQDSPAVTFMAVVLTLIVTVLVDLCAFALRAPLTATIPMLVFPVLNLAVGRPAAPLEGWLAVLALILVLLYVSARWARACEDLARAELGYAADRRGAGGLVPGAVSALAALAVGSLVAVMLPPASGLWWDAVAPTTSLATNRVNPIIDLGDDLRRGKPVTMLSYATSQTEGTLPYLSLVSLGDFSDGSEWRPREFAADSSLPTEQPVLPPQKLESDGWHRGTEENVNIILKPGVSAYLPHFTAIDSYAEVSGDYRRDETSGDVRQVDGESLQQSYHVTTAPLRPSDDELKSIHAEYPTALDPYLELPDEDRLRNIRAAMNEVVDPGASPYSQALQLQQWFTGGAFDYSERAPVSGGYDGTSVAVIDRFLEMRSGYCVHFASSMAVMGRMLGIPTRIQVGFTPGTQSSVNPVGQPVFEVTSDNLHAWAEFWVPGYGWVPFETTPASGLGEIPAPQPGASNETETEASPTAAPPTPTATPTPTPTPTPSESPTPTETPEPDTADNRSAPGVDLGEWWPIIARALVITVVFVLLLRLPGWLRQRQRRIRLERVRSGASGPMDGADAELHASAAAWREIRATAIDHGFTLRRGTIGVECQQLLRQLQRSETPLPDAQLQQVRAALQRLGAVWDHAAFAQPDATARYPTEADVRTVCEAIAEVCTPEVRRRAQRRPASLRASKARRRSNGRRGRTKR
ncbi:transglutaminaseTgpA domain-containing protein [uncultured Gulosibacter sp.]|uniref:DUF3488 and transglutaminase-like domain-containing protein n=1 Tax=uncultured Gulosibacter sp. TaxID=1339167 RepID=UPI0028898D61|nr:transglutaminaseTgpA domain-containing protein [uncultured Gulosibacter sp.]